MDTTLFSRRDVGHVRAQALSKKFEEENVFAASPLGIQSNEVNAKEYIKELLSKELKITQVKKSEAQIDEKSEAQIDEKSEAQIDEKIEAQIDEKIEAQIDEKSEAQIDDKSEAQIDD